MPTYKYFTRFGNRYDLNLQQFFVADIRYDSIRPPHSEKTLGRHAVLPFQRYIEKTFFSSDAYAGFFLGNGVFDCKGKQFYLSPGKFDAFSYRSGARFRYLHDFFIWQKNGIRERFDAIDLYPVPRKNRFRWKYDEIVAVRHKFFVRFSCGNIFPRDKYPIRFDRLQLKRFKNNVRWNVIPCDFLFKGYLRFDSVKKEFYQLPISHQALVRPGWRIVAKNIDTEEIYELGFIDASAEIPALEDVFLPDGEYEICVLTSSLFWKDAADHQIRTIVVGADTEITPLPTIYNLRSSVQIGTTLIQWSASKSELDDCVFGVWYGTESPVDTDRPPDTTIWYSSSMTEYQTTFEQQAPAWVAVAAIKPGNEMEKGKIHELYLDWSNTPPRAPDDVMVLDVPLLAFDTEIETRHEDDPFMMLWNG